MASVEQSTEMEKSSDSAPLSHSASQNSLMEAGQAQSHMHDVRVPELVYNIDEETRMGPENNNDGVNTLSTESPAKEREGKAVEPKAAPKEEPPTANPAAVNTFSALSFIASQYAESDNSSPRSSDSPAGMQEEGCGGVGPEPPEATGNSSDGFDTSSLMLAQDAPGVSLHTQAQRDVDTPSVTADRGGVDKSVVQGDVDKSSVTAVQGGVDTVQGAGEKSSVTPAQGAVDSSLTQAKGSVSCEQFAGVQVKEEKICSEKVGPGGDAATQPSAPSPPQVSQVELSASEVKVSKDGDVKMDVDQSKLISDERLEKKTGLDKDASVNNDVMDVDMEENVLTDADVKTLPKEENITEKVEPAGENVIKGVTNDVVKTVNEDVSDDVKVLSDKDVKQELPADKSVLSTHPEPMEISEPMETSDVKEQQSHVENEMMSKDIDLTSEKEAVDPVQLVKEGSGEPKPAPNTDSVLPTESKQLPVVETVAFSGQKPPPEREPAVSVPEDLKSESKVAPTIGSGMCEDSKPEAPDMDIVMCDEPKQAPSTDSAVADHPKLVRNAESVVSNMDSIMSEDSKLAPNMDSVMSDDSKLLSNLDSMLSSGLDESEDTFFAVKGPSAVVPFGENANSSMPIMEGKSLLEGENSNFSFVDESSQSNSMVEKPSRPKRARRSSISDIQDSKNEMEDGLHIFPAERVFEYQWPQDGGEWYLLQEQISEYLGVLSFKRKYPDLTRRTCDKLEKEFLREKGVVTETQSDLGLTAIRSEEVYDLMMKDYPDKYHEYATLLHEREKQKISDKHKEYEVAQPKLEKSKMADYMKKAAKSAAEYNRHLLRERKEERLAFFDLQTFMIQFPDGRYKKLPPEATKPSAYPVALIPGQFQDHYCSYTSDELRYFPLNTALYDPPKRMSNTLAKPAGSGESSDDSSEDKSGSSSDSSGSGSGSSDSETPASAAAAAAAASAAKGSNADSSQPVPRPPTPAEAAATPAKKSAKKGGKAAAAAKTPAKSPGRPLKGKRKLEVSAEEKESSGTSAASTPVVPPTAQPASPAPGKEKAEEEEDKDKCRICKNAVLFLKYKRVETKMIKCSECGKIAHPTCLDLTDKMVQVVTTYPWQCMECKTCVECMDPYDEDKMLFCDRCDRGYHTFCVGLRCLPSGRWECRSCKGVAETAKSRRGRPLKPT